MDCYFSNSQEGPNEEKGGSGIRVPVVISVIMCERRAIFLPMNCYFSELALYNIPTSSSAKWI